MARKKRDMTNKYYFSPRLTAKLTGMPTARTTLLDAPAGYGKTTAARYYLSKHLPPNAALVWLNCFDEPPVGAWQRFSRAIQKIDMKIGNELVKMRLPDENTKGEVVSLFMEMACASETYLVMDDFQYLKGAVPGMIWNALMEYGAKHLHTIILTRTPVERSMLAKPGILYLGQDDLRLTETEIAEYFEQSGIILTPAQIRAVNSYTEGWLAALYLQMRGYLETGSITYSADIHKMIRELVWDRLTDAERKFLWSVSPFESYTFSQAAYMMGVLKLPEYVRTLSEENAFIRQDPRERVYRPHRALLGFVRSIFNEVPKNERRDIIYRAGEWCAANKMPEQAMLFFYRLGEYERILSLNLSGMEFEQADETDYAEMLLDILENIPPEVKLANYAFVIKIILMLFGTGRYEQFGRWCGEIAALAAASNLPEPEKTWLAGEIALLMSFTKYNNVTQMGNLVRRAHELLGGKPSLIKMNGAWTFGNVSVLFMYHSPKGCLDTELADMSQNCAYYFALTKGHGSGGDILMKAEALFNRGEIADAAILAYKALYQAESKRQECVCIGAALLLGRLAVYRGDAGEFVAVLEQRILRYVEQNPLKSNRMAADMASSFLMELLERPQNVAGWLQKGDINAQQLFAAAIPYAQMLFGKYLIQSGKPEIWLGLENSALETANLLHCQMAVIYGKILSAAAWRSQGRAAKAKAALKAALNLALPDRLYMPFAENRPLLGSLLEKCCWGSTLEKILALAAKHETGKALILRELYPPRPFGFTDRECDVARLAARGFTNPEIAQKLFITRNTVKGYIKNVYQKMNISSRTELKKYFAEN